MSRTDYKIGLLSTSGAPWLRWYLRALIEAGITIDCIIADSKVVTAPAKFSAGRSEKPIR